MEKVYITTSLKELDQKGWLRRQEAGIDRVLGSIDVLDHGVEDGMPWIEVPGEAEVAKISQVISCQADKPIEKSTPADIGQQLADIRIELAALRVVVEEAVGVKAQGGGT